MKQLKAAIIGCGTIGMGSHAPAYAKSPNVEIAYCIDLIPERAQECAEKYGGKAITDYREMLKDPTVELVSVCTHNDLHAPISIECLNAGKNVLCEKPGSTCLDNVLAMKDAADKSGKILNIGTVMRFNNSVNAVKKLIDDGELGQVYHVYVSFRAHRSIPGLGGPFTTKAHAGGGVLIDWGVHYLDLTLYALGGPTLKTVSGQGYSMLGKAMKDYVYIGMWAGPPDYNGTYDVDDCVTGLVRTDGPTISLNGAWAQNINVPEAFIDFMGDKAGVRLKFGGSYTLYGTKDGQLTEEAPELETHYPFQDEIDSFADCVRTGQKNRCSVDQYLGTQQLLDTLYASSDAGKEIAL